MNGQPHPTDVSLPVAALERIDRICLEFEAAWKTGKPPRIEDYLGDTQGAERGELLRQLLLLDLDYRRGRDEHPTPGEYLRRFPRDGKLVNDVFNIPRADATTDFKPVTERPGAVVGRYKLMEKIGEGGMGVVYVAEQQEPVRRRVALKIIKPGMDTNEVIARFEAERQALALMDHPNIARVLDAGATDSGRPYFVMELIRGVPITDYCDNNSLTARQRLELFVSVCQAVQHAHQKGIIHRDVKPTNVMVTLHDGVPVPKIIDFGVAKATGLRLTERTIYTRFAQMLGTPLYMSPEQAGMSGLDVDTRTDIYSLGVLLYELLTGATPFDKQRIREAAWDQLLKIIREEEPPKPSTRVSTLGDEATTVSAHRRTDAKNLARLLRGDLDWIVMKALEKDRTRRYQTANGFALDVMRYLNDEPVVASPPSAVYRFRKFARRNKVALTTAIVVAAVLVLGMIGTTWEAILATQAEGRFRRERDRAVTAEQAWQAEAKRANREAERAKTEAAISQAVTGFLNNDLLARTDPEKQPDRDIKLRTVLARASEKIEGRFEDEPLVEAGVRMTLGSTYSSVGGYTEAERHFQRAQEIYRRERGPEHTDTLRIINDLAIVYFLQGRYDEAEKVNAEVLEVRRRILGVEHPDTLKSMNNVAIVYRHQGRYEEAEKLFTDLLEVERRVLGSEHPDTLSVMHNLAAVYENQRRYEDAEKLNVEVLEVRRRALGSEHPDTLGSMNNVAIVYTHQGRYEEAEGLFADLLKIDPSFGPTYNDLAWLLSTCPDPQFRDADRAVELAERAVELAPQAGPYWNTLGVARYRAGDPKGAIAALEKSVKLHSGQHGLDWLFLAMAHWQLGHEEEARHWYSKAVERMKQTGCRNPEHHRFAREAAELFGLAPPPAVASAPTSKQSRDETAGPGEEAKTAPRLLEPAEGAVVGNLGATWEFKWSQVEGATAYELYVIGASAEFPIISATTHIPAYRCPLRGYIIDRNARGWTWKVRAITDQGPLPWSDSRTFDVEPLSSRVNPAVPDAN